MKRLYFPVMLLVLLFSVTVVPLAQGQTIFGSDLETDNLINISTLSGAGNLIGDTGFTLIEGLACDIDTSTLYAVDFATNQLLRINQDTGAGTVIGAIGFTNVFALAFDSNSNTLYGAEIVDDQLLRIDPNTGVATVVGEIGFNAISSLAFDHNANILYAVDVAFSDFKLIRISPNTGQGSFIADLSSGNIGGLTFDNETNTLFASDIENDQLISIDTNTGEINVIGNTGFNFVDSLASCNPRLPRDIPTLSEWGLIAMAGILGIVGFMVMRRRKATA